MSHELPGNKRRPKLLWLLTISASAGICVAAWYIASRPHESELGLPEIDTSLSLQDAFENGDWTLGEDARQRLLGIELEFRPGPGYLPEFGNAHVLEGGRHAVDVRSDQITPHEMIPALAARPNQKLVITGDEFKQFFSAYCTQDHPIFITTDSILNCFHILFEDTYISLEAIDAALLPNLLEKTAGELQELVLNEQGSVENAAARRAQIVLGVAQQLINPNARTAGDSALQQIIRDELSSILAANETKNPEWLGINEPAFVGMDYSEYRPLSFYAQDVELQQYYRAVRWLQTIPFRVNQDADLLAFAMIVAAMREADEQGWRRLANSSKELFGEKASWDIGRALDIFPKQSPSIEQLPGIRQLLLTGDQGVRLQPMDNLVWMPGSGREFDPNVCVLSGYLLPDQALMKLATDIEQFGMRTPTGLDLCVGLGSQFAREHLPEEHREKVIQVIDENRKLLEGTSIYAEYLNCLRALFVPAPEGAPAFMNESEWQAKSCQTALGGWTQFRHTTALQARSWVGYLNGDTRTVRGFIEPNPEFYRRLAALARRIQALVETMREPDVNRAVVQRALQTLARKVTFLFALNELYSPGLDDKTLSKLSIPDREFAISLVSETYALTGLSVSLRQSLPGDDSPFRVNGNRAILAMLVQLEEQLRSHGLPLSEPWNTFIVRLAVPHDKRWGRFIELSDKLAMFSEQQLKSEEISQEQDDFLAHYGDGLADLLLYDYHAGTQPRDDAMRVAHIYNSPVQGRLHVAVGRPRAIYVLYPYQGKEILCRGAVMPYYEFLHSSPLTDSEWRQMFDSPERPALPDWLRPIYAK